MARLFVAIDIPEAQRDALAELSADELDVRWTPREQYHLTLRFIGESDDAQQNAVSEALTGIDLPSFQLAGEGLDVFPSRRRPRVLVARLDENPVLQDLRTAVNDVVVDAGFDEDPKSFNPHITFGRVKRARPREIRSYMKARASFRIEPFAVRRFYLYRSDLGPSGAVHTVQGSFSLRDD